MLPLHGHVAVWAAERPPALGDTLLCPSQPPPPPHQKEKGSGNCT